MEMEENPNPTLAFQSCFGPSFDHVALHRFSFEMPLPSEPRQCGQSSARNVKTVMMSESDSVRGTVVRMMLILLLRRDAVIAARTTLDELLILEAREMRLCPALILLPFVFRRGLAGNLARRSARLAAVFEISQDDLLVLTQPHASERVWKLSPRVNQSTTHGTEQ